MKTLLFILFILTFNSCIEKQGEKLENKEKEIIDKSLYEAFHSTFPGLIKEDALRYVDKALSIDSNNIAALTLKALILSISGEKEDASSYYDKVLELDSSHKMTLFNYSPLLIEKGDYLTALNLINKYIDIDKKHSINWYRKGKIFSLMKKKKEMLVNLRYAIFRSKEYKKRAKEDIDFKKYWDDPDFIELTKEK